LRVISQRFEKTVERIKELESMQEHILPPLS